jgi:hypothetical protein
MFCGNCGNKTVEGNLFCVTCGQPQAETLASNADAAPVLGETQPPVEEPNVVEVPEWSPPAVPLPATTTSAHGGTLSAPAAASGNWFLRNKVLVGIGAGLIAVLLVVLATTSSSASGMPPADPAQALHRLKEVTNIDLPIDDAAVDVSQAITPSNISQQPSAVGEYLGAVSMTSGGTVELRVSAYALDSDAAAYTLWWNTSGAKESIGGSVAVQCGRIVVDGAWVDRHSHDETTAMLKQAYPDCTPYIPENATPATPAPAAPEPSPTVEAMPVSPVEGTPAPEPTPTRTQPPRVDGVVNGGHVVPGAFVITNLVVSDKNPNNTTVSFTAKNTTKLKLLLVPEVGVTDEVPGPTGETPWTTGWGGDQGIGTPCYIFSPYESERITIGQGHTPAGPFPTNWTSAVVTNTAYNCE